MILSSPHRSLLLVFCLAFSLILGGLVLSATHAPTTSGIGSALKTTSPAPDITSCPKPTSACPAFGIGTALTTGPAANAIGHFVGGISPPDSLNNLPTPACHFGPIGCHPTPQSIGTAIGAIATGVSPSIARTITAIGAFAQAVAPPAQP